MFDRLIGNDEVKESLRHLLKSGRVPGSLLFTGHVGIGKKLFALELAKAMNCRNRVGVEACDDCSSCKRISRSTFPPFGTARWRCRVGTACRFPRPLPSAPYRRRRRHRGCGSER